MGALFLFARALERGGELRRVAAALIDGIEVHNLYVPAGADEPEMTNPKFVHKLDVLDRMKRLGS